MSALVALVGEPAVGDGHDGARDGGGDEGEQQRHPERRAGAQRRLDLPHGDRLAEPQELLGQGEARRDVRGRRAGAVALSHNVVRPERLLQPSEFRIRA